jgi:two-component system alkaline phosphatase synthesis response regulator PhoP
VLEEAGFRVTTAGDGDEAWEKIQKDRPDFISLDLVLPRRSGHKLLRDLRQRPEYAKIPTLIVTAHSQDDLGKPMMEGIFGATALLGPGLYLEKPVQPATYVRCVCQALGVEMPEEDSTAAVRQGILDMVRHADSATLNRVASALKKGRSP